MDFSDILSQWERRRGGEDNPGTGDQNMERMLDSYPPPAEREEESRPSHPGLGRRALKKMRPQDELDLHGLSEREAGEALTDFIRRCRLRGLKKVLIIHGKGRHSSRGPVLGKAVRDFLQRCPHTGEFGNASREDGGQGAVWVILR
jgi:DNA-nicking Smr family endonuclease